MTIIAIQAQEVKYGPEYKPHHNEYVVWHQGEPVAWAGTEEKADRSYHEILTLNREHITRNPANGANGDTPPPDWASCKTCGFIIDLDDFCQACAPEVIND